MLRNDLAEAIISCQTGRDVRTPSSLPDPNQSGNQVALAQCGPYAGRAGFWTHEWRETDIPDVWDTRSPVALGPAIWGLDQAGENGPFQDSYSEDSFDPQVTLRYRPTDEHSLYAKWAKAFKAGGFDTSDRGISRGGLFYPTDFKSLAFGEDGQKEFTYLAEHAENFELGARGNLFDSQVRYGVTLFHMEVNDLQLETEIADIDQLLTTGQAPTGRYLTNAGKQRNKGVEFDFTWAAADRLTLRAAGVVQDSVMVEYFGGCTEVESANAADGPCINAAEARTFLGLPATGTLSAIDQARVDALDGSIDRSGSKAPRAPDWKIILGADYEQPLFGNYIGMVNTKMAISDGYTEDTLGFTHVKQWPTHADLNTNISFGDADKTWDVALYARNILGARQKYYPEFEAESEQPGIQTDDMPQSAFFNYGIQFNYYYR